MSDPIIRNFTPQDIPQVMALQKAYQQVYPHINVIPGEVYLSPGFADGKNIFCALDEAGLLLGYAPLFPVLTEDPQTPNIIWAEARVSPQSPSYQEVKDRLFDRIVPRARELAQTSLSQSAQLTFQYHPTEEDSIAYVVSRGCAYSESVFRLLRDLSQDLPVVPAPEQIEIQRWHMESEQEQQAYVQAHNEAFPEAPVTLADWQSFLQSPAWEQGTTITAFDQQEIAGCVTVYLDEAISQQVGRKVGFSEYIFVRPSWRKRGIAPYMICQALAYLKERGREAAVLEVKAANQRALDLYFGLGYQLVDETRLYVLDL